MHSAHDPAPNVQLHRKRQAVLELEYALDALDKQMQVLAEELHATETAKISRFLENLTGTKQRQIDRIHALQDQLNCRRGQMNQMLEGLNQEIATLNDLAKEAATKQSQHEARRDQRRKEIESNGGEQAEQLAKCRVDAECSEVMLNKLKSALDASEEARRDLLSEMETVSTFGRNKMLRANRALKMISNHVRKSATEDCARRVRQSMTRLKRKLDDLLQVNTKDGEIDTLCNEVAFHIETFAASDLNQPSAMEHSATLLHDLLQMVAMTLEHRITSTQSKLTDARNRYDKLLDSAPDATNSLGSDAVQMTTPAQE